MKNNNGEDIRNVIIPLAVAKPEVGKKGLIVGLITLYLMLLVSYLSKGFLTDYVYLEVGLICLLLFVCSSVYDYIYRCNIENVIDETMSGVVIGFSNKLLVLSGEEVLKEFDTDEIEIRSVDSTETEVFFSKYTTVIECRKNGEIVGRLGVDKLEEYEGLVLKADNSRADEDLEIIYDEDPDQDYE